MCNPTRCHEPAVHNHIPITLFDWENQLMRACLIFIMILSFNCSREWKSPFEPDNGIPCEGMVACYKFSGNTQDESTNSFHLGLIKATYDTDRLNQPNSAMLFNGLDAYLVNNNLLTVEHHFTISLWIKPTTTHEIDEESISSCLGTSGQKFAIGPTHGNSWSDKYAGLGISAGTNGISVYEHASYYMPAVLVWEGAVTGWTHVVVLYQNKQCTLYVNGKKKRIGLKSERDAQPSTRYFGAAHHGSFSGDGIMSFFPGLLDDVRVYDRVLTTTEIETLYYESENSVCCDRS